MIYIVFHLKTVLRVIFVKLVYKHFISSVYSTFNNLIFHQINNASMAKFAVYLMTMCIQLVSWCWPGDLLIQESTAVCNTIFYGIPWYLMTVKEQRSISFIIFRTQKELQITALNFQVMSVRKLTEVKYIRKSIFLRL